MMPYRSPGPLSTERPEKLPFLWGLRVWLASRHVTATTGESLCVGYRNTAGEDAYFTVQWDRLEDCVSRWERTPAGEPLAERLRNDGEEKTNVILVQPTCVPTMIRLARTAADAYARSRRNGSRANSPS